MNNINYMAQLNIEELLEKRKQKLAKIKGLVEGKVVAGKELKELAKKRTRKGEGFRSLVGKEILIKDIKFENGTAYVTVEVDGQEKVVRTSDKMLIKRWLLDFKAALDLGAKAIKVKVEPLGKGGVKFV
jgi:uncharacterized protein with von Willebrand factor type A (vWA) domain